MPLLGYWPLNESSGSTARDYSGQGNNGTVNNGGDSTVVAGGNFLGQNCYSFDGSNDEVDLGDPNLVDGATSLSVAAWCKKSSWSGNEGIMTKIDSGNPDNFRLWSDGSTFYFYLDEGSNTSLSTSTLPATGQWVLIIGTWDGSTRRLYYDNTEITSDSLSGSLIDCPGPLSIGSGKGKSTWYYTGDITEVRLYNHALTKKEIQYLYEAGRRGRLRSSAKRS